MREPLEQRLGANFDAVRVHHGPAAAASARALQSRAYTIGSDIVFGRGQFAPNEREGRHLLSHELVHVAQQSSSSSIVHRQEADTTTEGSIEVQQQERSRAILGYPVRLGFEQWLAARGVDAINIDWTVMIPQLRANPRFESQSLIQASDYQRYLFFLDLLEQEVAQGSAAAPNSSVDLGTLQSLTAEYVESGIPFTPQIQELFSENFLSYWAGELAQIRFVPDDIRIEDFQPRRDILESERTRVLDEFVRFEAPGALTRAILDDFTVSGLSPEDFLKFLDLPRYRERLIDKLTALAKARAASDERYRSALRSAVNDQARLEILRLLVRVGRGAEAAQRDLIEHLNSQSLQSAGTLENQVAWNPAHYVSTLRALAGATYVALQSAKSGSQPDLTIIDGGLQAAQQLSPEFGALEFIVVLAAKLDAFRKLTEGEAAEARKRIAAQVSLRFDEIASVVRHYSDYANRFIQEQWLPMLKTLALERIDAAYAELKKWYTYGDQYTPVAIARLELGAAALEHICQQLEQGQVSRVELEDTTLTGNDVPDLRNTIKVMRARAQQLGTAEGLKKKWQEIKEALDVYADVRKRIEDGTYKPLDYGQAVAAQARHRLGIEWFERDEFITQGMVLSGEVTAPKNPFVAYAIVRWHFEETLARETSQAAIMIGLGLLTVAAILATGGAAETLIPSAVGMILTALDVGAAIVTAGLGVHDAGQLLDLALLDESLAGVSVDEAKKALRHAWINLAVTIVLTIGIPALMTAVRFIGERIGTARLTNLAAAAERDPVRTAAVLRQLGGNAARLEQLLAAVQGDLWRVESLLAYAEDPSEIEALIGRVKDGRLLEGLLIGARAQRESAGYVAWLLDRGVSPAQLERFLAKATDILEVGRVIQRLAPERLDELLVYADSLVAVQDALIEGGNDKLALQLLMEQQVASTRKWLNLPTAAIDFPPSVKRPVPEGLKKNVAVGMLHIRTSGRDEIIKYRPAVSGKTRPGTLQGTGAYKEFTTPQFLRATDTEVKILENAKRDLAGITDYSQTKVIIYTEREQCRSCQGVINQFERDHPGIKVEILYRYSLP